MFDVCPFLAWSNLGERSPAVGVAFATHVETRLLPALSRPERGSHERPIGKPGHTRTSAGGDLPPARRQDPADRDYWAAIAELLDLLVAGDLEIGTTAQRLGITTGAISKLILHDDQVARVVNDLRRGRNMRPRR
jgi:hypothetical protein